MTPPQNLECSFPVRPVAFPCFVRKRNPRRPLSRKRRRHIIRQIRRRMMAELRAIRIVSIERIEDPDTGLAFNHVVTVDMRTGIMKLGIELVP